MRSFALTAQAVDLSDQHTQAATFTANSQPLKGFDVFARWRWSGVILVLAAGLALLSKPACAESFSYLSRTVWGCVDPNEAASINDPSNPARSDPRWLARTANDGQCITLVPGGLWISLSGSYNGLTYIRHQGSIGTAGSFWVPTAALTPDVSPPSPTTRNQAPNVLRNATKSPVAATRPFIESAPPPPPEPPAAPSQQPAASTPTVMPPVEQPGSGRTIIWVIVSAVVVFNLFGGLRRPKKSIQRAAKKVESVPAKPTAGITFRIHPSSLIDIQESASPTTELTGSRKTDPGLEAIHPTRVASGGSAPDTRATGQPGVPTETAGPNRVESVRNPAKPTAGITFRIHPSSLINIQQPASSAAKSTVPPKSGLGIEVSPATRLEATDSAPNPLPNWHPPEKSVSIAGTTIPDGMVYVGRFGVSYGQYDGCVIDPTLPLASSAAAEPLGYYPSYHSISPHCRVRYLEWLGSGKRSADIDIGYVFLYLYGLERRLIVDRPPASEVATLTREILRLRSLYGSDRSFDGYCSRLVEAIEFLSIAASGYSTIFVPGPASLARVMPLPLKLVVAREVAAGRSLGFDLAAAAIFGLDGFCANHRHVLEHGRLPFLQVLRTRFATAFPTGFVVKNRKNSRLQAIYRGATAGLHVDLAAQAGLPDLPEPADLTWTKLLILAETAAKDLAPLATLLAYYPARAASLFGLIDCPPELRDSIATEGQSWLAGLPSPAPVAFSVLVKHAIGDENKKWTVRHRRRISQALAAVGYVMEPGPDDAIDRLDNDTVVQVVRGISDGRSREMVVATAAAMLVVGIARENSGPGIGLEEFWLSQVPSRLLLRATQVARLRARLAWFRTGSVTITKVKRMLGDATQDEREFCAWSATVTAGAAGMVDKPGIAVLEAIHDALGVARTALYAGLHVGLGTAGSGAGEPVEVSGEVVEINHPIPRPPTSGPTGPDRDRLARIRAETDQVSAQLADIFTEDESPPDIPHFLSDNPLAALDSEHATFVMHLVTRHNWTRPEFENLAVASNLMPEGAMETINEWAFDHYRGPLLEDADPITVNLDLLPEDFATIAARP